MHRDFQSLFVGQKAPGNPRLRTKMTHTVCVTYFTLVQSLSLKPRISNWGKTILLFSWIAFCFCQINFFESTFFLFIYSSFLDNFRLSYLNFFTFYIIFYCYYIQSLRKLLSDDFGNNLSVITRLNQVLQGFYTITKRLELNWASLDIHWKYFKIHIATQCQRNSNRCIN